MIVDDTLGSREAVARLLQREGYETVCAANGEDAIHQMRRSNPDLILLDHMMPKVDGLTFLAQLRRFPRWKTLPVIMYTGIPDHATQMKARAPGVAEYFIKAEHSAPDLIGHVQRLLPVG